MPRGNQMPASMVTAKLLILGDPRVGKSDWAMRAAEAGFNVLYIDGDGAGRTLAQIDPKHSHRIYYFNVMDRMDEGSYDCRMIDFVANFFASGKILWNDTTQAEFNRARDNVEESEIWEIRPSQFDHNWVIVIDSWTTLSQSASAAKAADLGVELADVEKVDRKIYSGVGNRLTQIATIFKGLKCHVIVTGHPAEYAKKRAPDGSTARNVKEEDMITEWTRMIPKSSSNPHGLTLGKNFTDIGWIDISRTGKRVLDFDITMSRVSGGIMTGKGDPRDGFRFQDIVAKMGGHVPGPNADIDPAPALVIHEKGAWQPAAAKPAMVLGSKTPAGAAPTQVATSATKGLGALMTGKKG